MLGFYNHVSTQVNATRACMDSLRKIYPNNPVILSIDGNQYLEEFHKIAKDYNCDLAENRHILGYPPYDAYTVRQWLNRFLFGVLRLKTDHVAMIEDDMLFNFEMPYDENVEYFGHSNPPIPNTIPEIVRQKIRDFSGVDLKTDYYSCGGGSIFKAQTFIENYYLITNHLINEWDFYVEHFYPQIGYMDCFLAIFYMLCGKEYTPNLNLYNLDPHEYYNNRISYFWPSGIMKEGFQKYAWIHNYKYNYI